MRLRSADRYSENMLTAKAANNPSVARCAQTKFFLHTTPPNYSLSRNKVNPEKISAVSQLIFTPTLTSSYLIMKGTIST